MAQQHWTYEARMMSQFQLKVFRDKLEEQGGKAKELIDGFLQTMDADRDRRPRLTPVSEQWNQTIVKREELETWSTLLECGGDTELRGILQSRIDAMELRRPDKH